MGTHTPSRFSGAAAELPHFRNTQAFRKLFSVYYFNTIILFVNFVYASERRWPPPPRPLPHSSRIRFQSAPQTGADAEKTRWLKLSHTHTNPFWIINCCSQTKLPNFGLNSVRFLFGGPTKTKPKHTRVSNYINENNYYCLQGGWMMCYARGLPHLMEQRPN